MITGNTITDEYKVIEFADDEGVVKKDKKEATMALLSRLSHDEPAMGAININHLGPDIAIGDKFTYELKITPIELKSKKPEEPAAEEPEAIGEES